MPRAVWTGSLAFGLVSIPVALYPATKPKDVRFHLFDRQGRRVRYRRYAEGTEEHLPEPVEPADEAESGGPSPEQGPAGSPSEGDGSIGAAGTVETPRPLEYGDLLRGFEVEPGRFAMLEHEEIERARPTRSSTIELEDFVELGAIDPVFFEKTYYVAPRPDAAKPYRLLQQALDRTNRVGIGRFVLRTKPHLVAIRPTQDVLALETLFFGDEVRPAAEVLPLADHTISDRELHLAEQRVEMLATDWDPSRYADEYREELLRIIAEKMPIETDEADQGLEAGGSSGIEQLMDALKRSVEEARAARDRDDRASETG
jgi:DNA end-binding protein Ku